MRSVIMLTKDKGDTSLRHLCVVKNNYLAEKDKKLSYVIKFNENLQFKATGKRVDINDLDDPEYLDQAKEMLAQGKSLRDISESLNKLGYVVSKSTLQRRLK